MTLMVLRTDFQNRWYFALHDHQLLIIFSCVSHNLFIQSLPRFITRSSTSSPDQPDNHVHEVRALDNNSLTAHLPQTEVDSILSGTKEQQSISNLIRLSLLHRHGGVWADATTICMQPLDEWLPAAASSGFFAFRAHAEGRPLSNWFLAATPHHLIVKRLQDASIAYWVGRKSRHIYFWTHGLFSDLLKQDPEFKKAWKLVPDISSRHDFHFGPKAAKLLAPAPPDLASQLARPPSPVFKLTYKGMDRAPKGSLYDALLHYARGEPLDL